MFGFVSGKAHLELRHRAEKLLQELEVERRQHHERIMALERMNTRLQADLNWAQHRLNQVERERGQLIYAAIGVKIAVPEFQQTYRPDQTLNEAHNPFMEATGGMPGEDSMATSDRLDADQTQQQQDGVNYSLMPGFGKPRT